MKRSNQYEAAFEGYLQHHRHCYVAVDETRRAWSGELRVKNLDFIVHTAAGARLLIDVKGRRFPAGPPEHPRRVWECWSTQEDIDGLLRWQMLFGSAFRGMLVFIYQLLPSVILEEACPDLWLWHGRRYVIRAVTVEDYRREMRGRSQRWGTVFLPGATYRALARPFAELAGEPAWPVEAECPF
jgi:hypothetical protein